MKIIIAVGAFKHSLSVLDALQAITTGLKASGLPATLVGVPVADGGNGTLDALLYQGGGRRTASVYDPLGRSILADYGLLDDATAVIEMAQASGLELLTAAECNPLQTSTVGTGQLLEIARTSGARRILLGMGGSATVDAGIGAMGALGVQFYDADDQPLDPVPRNLKYVERVVLDAVRADWEAIQVTVAVDVDNPAVGERGAARVFGPQKGADSAMIETLDTGIDHFLQVLEAHTGRKLRHLTGSGAAGGLPAGLAAVLNVTITSGIDLILDHAGFTGHLQDADLVITGEGRLDTQSFGGKTPLGVARIAREYDVPVIAFTGSLDADEAHLQSYGMRSVLPIVDRPMPLDQALATASDLLYRAARRLGYLLTV